MQAKNVANSVNATIVKIVNEYSISSWVAFFLIFIFFNIVT
jgi:hypothetical protein